MIDLVDFYNKHSSSCYKDMIEPKKGFIKSYSINSEKNAIEEFKQLTYPYNPGNDSYTVQNDLKYLYVCNYLNELGYVIDEFPSVLHDPCTRVHFSYDLIRGKVLEQTHSSPVKWDDRRILINNLHFRKSFNYNFTDDIKIIIEDISTSHTSFDRKTNDEKLETLCNAIEYLLKEGDKFQKLDYASETLGLISDDSIKDYRNKMQIFRHAKPEYIKARNEMSDVSKQFFIDYGVLIVKLIKQIKDKLK
ncbi:MAG: hypothetical protein K5923_03210 [Clostridia bacterium]|nr:hypothetical protein [Clostridia bacterium]